MKQWGMIVRIAVAAALAFGSFAAGAGAAHADKLPVQYNFLGGIPNELMHHGGSLPGSNDWGCKPSARHPNPVVLAHGTGGSQQTNWGTYVPLLKNEGYCVFALTYGAPKGLPWPFTAVGGMGKMENSAREFGAFTRKVLRATGAQKIDVIGHSQGTIIPNYYLKHLGGKGTIDKYVSIAPAFYGTTLAGTDIMLPAVRRLGITPDQIPLCAACAQLDPNSPFLLKVRVGGVYLPDVQYTNIGTRYDELVVPYWASMPPGGRNVRNIVVQDGCSVDFTEHAGVAGSRRAAYFALNALDPAHPRTVPCDRAAPITGSAF